MTLETIVPPLSDCQRIPQGAFTDSALGWRKTKEHKERFDVFPRECGECSQYSATSEVYPAPTLEEIMAEIPGVCTVKASNSCIKHDDIDEVFHDKNLATAALRLWLRVKGGKNE